MDGLGLDAARTGRPLVGSMEVARPQQESRWRVLSSQDQGVAVGNGRRMPRAGLRLVPPLGAMVPNVHAGR